MSDDADVAAALADERIAAGLARISGVIPRGQPGECEECGETMPRLVGGRCGFCRDGRRPPLDRYAALPPIPIPSPAEEPTTMPYPSITPEAQTIAVPAKGDVLAAIKRRAERDNQPLGRSAAAISGVLSDPEGRS